MAGCTGCRSEQDDFGLAMAFQPIVDVEEQRVVAYEALVRGLNGEGAGEMLSRVTSDNRYAFDQQCRVAAIEQAVAAGIVDTGAKLSINFLPNAVYSPVACIQLTLKTARAVGLPTDRLVFEFTENERMMDTTHVADIIATYRRMGFATALDDFGAGHAGLGLLARLQTDVVKLDMELIRDIDQSMPRRMIVDGVVRMLERMDIGVIAEGIETEAEYAPCARSACATFRVICSRGLRCRRCPRFIIPKRRSCARWPDPRNAPGPIRSGRVPLYAA